MRHERDRDRDRESHVEEWEQWLRRRDADDRGAERF